tara:strand:+ start:1865 stop:2077 length:213 start_codon:yes stop_codon:yes gene_type:complete
MKKNTVCEQAGCRLWVDYKEDLNCCLVSVHENGNMTLRQIGDRLGVSFARVKQIETEALRKIRKSPLLND